MIELSSSIVSTTITTCVVYPAQRVKLQMHLNSRIKSLKEAIKIIYQRDGLKGFYTGLSAQIFGNGVSYAIYFVAYAQAKKMLGCDLGSFRSVAKCSGLAGTASSIATNPFWVLKTKQAEKGVSILKAGQNLVKHQGIFALWKGQMASLILVTNPIIQFGIYELLKRKLPAEKGVFFDVMIFIIGAISKIIATLMTYPYTLIRTKQHVSTGKGGSLFKTFLRQLQQNGVSGLFSGMSAKMLQTVLNSALLLMIYQRMVILLTKLIKKIMKK